MEHKMHHLTVEHLKEEIEDACEYLREADEAESEGDHYLAHGLKKMALDEYTHAHFLRKHLISEGLYHEHDHHDEIEAHWHKLRGRLGLEA